MYSQVQYNMRPIRGKVGCSCSGGAAARDSKEVLELFLVELAASRKSRNPLGGTLSRRFEVREGRSFL